LSSIPPIFLKEIKPSSSIAETTSPNSSIWATNKIKLSDLPFFIAIKFPRLSIFISSGFDFSISFFIFPLILDSKPETPSTKTKSLIKFKSIFFLQLMTFSNDKFF